MWTTQTWVIKCDMHHTKEGLIHRVTKIIVYFQLYSPEQTAKDKLRMTVLRYKDCITFNKWVVIIQIKWPQIRRNWWIVRIIISTVILSLKVSTITAIITCNQPTQQISLQLTKAATKLKIIKCKIRIIIIRLLISESNQKYKIIKILNHVKYRRQPPKAKQKPN